MWNIYRTYPRNYSQTNLSSHTWKHTFWHVLQFSTWGSGIRGCTCSREGGMSGICSMSWVHWLGLELHYHQWDFRGLNQSCIGRNKEITYYAKVWSMKGLVEWSIVVRLTALRCWLLISLWWKYPFWSRSWGPEATPSEAARREVWIFGIRRKWWGSNTRHTLTDFIFFQIYH